MSKLNEVKWRKFCYDHIDGEVDMLLTAIELHMDESYDAVRGHLNTVANTVEFFKPAYAIRIWAMGAELDQIRWEATYNRRRYHD